MVEAAGRHVNLLSRELGGDPDLIADRLGIDGDGLHEAAWGRSPQMFWTVCDPHQWPGPLSAGAVAGAWLHGALCGAATHVQANGRPQRSATHQMKRISGGQTSLGAGCHAPIRSRRRSLGGGGRQELSQSDQQVGRLDCESARRQPER